MRIGGTATVPQAVKYVELCQRFHWTLDYVRSLSPEDYDAIVEVTTALDMAQAEVSKRGW